MALVLLGKLEGPASSRLRRKGISCDSIASWTKLSISNWNSLFNVSQATPVISGSLFIPVMMFINTDCWFMMEMEHCRLLHKCLNITSEDFDTSLFGLAKFLTNP